MAFHGDFTPVLAKHTKHLSLVDVLSIGIDRIQRTFEPMKKQVEAWDAGRSRDSIDAGAVNPKFAMTSCDSDVRKRGRKSSALPLRPLTPLLTPGQFRHRPIALPFRTNTLCYNELPHDAEVAELADAQDLGSCGREAVGVQLPPSALAFLRLFRASPPFGWHKFSPPQESQSSSAFRRLRAGKWREMGGKRQRPPGAGPVRRNLSR
jgi:hypothetical protein